MSSDDGIVGLVIGSPIIALALYVLYTIGNGLKQTPTYQSLQPAQQSTFQNIQNLGGQAITLADPTLVEVVVAVVAAVAAVVGLIALLSRR